MIYLLTDHAEVQLKLNKNITIPRQALLLQASAIYSDKFKHICFFLLWENVFEVSPLEERQVTAKYCPWEETAVVLSPPGRTVQTQAGFLLLMITQKISSPVPSRAPHVPLHSVVILKQVSRHKLNASMNVGRDRHTDLFFLPVFSVHITEDSPTPVLTKTRAALLSVSHWCTSRLAAAISPRSFWRAILLFVKWLWIISQSEWSNRH